MACHDKKLSLWTPCALVPGEVGVFSADMAQWVLINLGQVHMKWCFQVEAKPMAKHLETAAPATLFHSVEPSVLLWGLAKEWRDGQSQVSILFTYLSGCSPGDRKMPVAVCAGAAELPSRASLGCLPLEEHFFQSHLLRTKDCCVQMRTASSLSSFKAAWLEAVHWDLPSLAYW